jgi:nicotinate-nucleotide adenylyltransferase
MHILRQQYPGAELFYLMGGDSLSQLPTWERPHEFIQVCDAIVVMHRPNERVDCDALENVLPGIKQKTVFVKAPLIEISGADIRWRVAERKPFRYYLPDPVYRLILELNLYRDSS